MADNRIYNFSAGPSMLPVPVLERCASEMLNYKGSGMSVMEMSHRSKVYDGIITETEAALRRVLSIPDNYKVLFTDRNVLDFPKMFMTTFIIACFTCVISVIFVLSVAYCMSRMRFRVRKTFMNVVLILGMFPGIMAVTAIYFILKALGLSSGAMTTVALILVYSAGSGAGFYVMKGYMDTIPTSLDEAALLDGCTRFQVFYKIIIPICKPMIVYQAIIGFLTPWLDFVMAKVICRTQSNYTVALGLWLMLQKEYIQNWYARFAAAAVVISIPIAILFIVMQRFYQESMSGSVKG